jgi:hypothetical protein
MNLRELRPRHGKHLRRRVELHRAGAERNHRGRERQVARFEPLDVAEHFGLGMVTVEDGVLEERRGAGQRCENSDADSRPNIRNIENSVLCRHLKFARISNVIFPVVSSSEMPMVFRQLSENSLVRFGAVQNFRALFLPASSTRNVSKNFAWKLCEAQFFKTPGQNSRQC